MWDDQFKFLTIITPKNFTLSTAVIVCRLLLILNQIGIYFESS